MADSYLSFKEIDRTVLSTLEPATRRYWTAVVLLAGGGDAGGRMLGVSDRHGHRRGGAE